MKTRLFLTSKGTATRLHRATVSLLVPVLFITSPSFLQAADSMAQQAATIQSPSAEMLPAKHSSVPHTPPKFESGTPSLTYSANPTDAEISGKLLFAEPLIPIGGRTSASENQDVAAALTAFGQRKVRDDFSSLEAYLAAHPHSAWNISLLTNLGDLYRYTGWYGKAMEAWQQAWIQGQATTDVSTNGKVIIDRALVESIVMNGRVGRMSSLSGLIQMADKRQLTGSSKEKVEAAKQALVLMQHHPETSFRCGPMAVEKLRNMADNNVPSKWKVLSDVSTQQGTSLSQLTKLSQKLSMDMIPAVREPGSSVLVPSVVNWKVGHFAAITGMEKGLIHLADPTFGNDVWISQKALDAEASGYFLVKRQQLPAGWKQISDQDAGKVWGKGQVSGSDDTCNSNKDCKTCHPNQAVEPGTPQWSGYFSAGWMSIPFAQSAQEAERAGSDTGDGTLSLPAASIHMMLASLCVEDTPLSYRPPYGPLVNLHISYSQREAYQPSVFTYSNMGPLWTFNWLSYITDDPSNPGTSNVTQYLSDGGTLNYAYNSTSHAYTPNPSTGGILKYNGSSVYELDLPDGSKQIFGKANLATPRNIFMTQSVDPQGNKLTFTYDINYRLMTVADALPSGGQLTTLSYEMPGDMYKITKVTDPFGRIASFQYNADGSLLSCTNVGGLVSTFSYQNGAMQSFTTPYGTTKFDVGQDTHKRWDQITDPQGGQERLETWTDSTGTSNITVPAASDVPTTKSGIAEDNTYIQYRNSFYWDKKAMMNAPGVYSQAQLVHWLETATGGNGTMTGQVECYKAPLENRVYYNYAGQPGGAPYVIGTSTQPISTTRVIDNGTTQLTQEFDAIYNTLGKQTQATGPPISGNSAGRITNFNYDTNNIDLLSTKQVNASAQDTVFAATYNSVHQPLTTTDPAGQQTTYTYTTTGEISTIKDPKLEVKTFGYNGNGYLTSVTDQITGASTSYTYDGFGRVGTSTDVNGYTLTYTYDNLDRVTLVTYPDGTTEQNIYRKLDLAFHKDRLNRWTQYLYNSIEQLVAMVDPQGRTTSYQRCACGELLSMTDSYGHKTAWTNDIQGRLTQKTFPDGRQYNYTYVPSTSRLFTFTDSKSQVTTYSYNLDDTTQQMAYTNAAVATPSVSFVYDPYYPRINQMSDGTGATNYTYYGAGGLGGGRVHTEASPIPNSTITYTYDELGRGTSTSINGTASTVTYDSVNRILTETDSALSSTAFSYSYYGATPRLQTITYPNGQSTNYTYQTGATQDFRLTDITNDKTGTTVLSKFDYTYNTNGTIATWQQQTDSNAATTWNYTYDKADQLLSAVKKNSSQAVLAQDVYQYDLAGNRTSEQIGLSVKTATYNNLNQLTGTSGGGPLQFTGTLSQAARVTVGGNPATVDASNNFSGAVNLPAGTNVVAVVATDYSGNAGTNRYQVVVPSNAAVTPAYDLNGNLTNNGAGQTYEWDAKDELTAINYSGTAIINGVTRSTFAYDGLSRRVKIVESTGTTKQFVWVGDRMAEERDASGNVTKRFFALGEQISGTTYYLTRDHLGSIRELTNSSGTTQARYDYDPYGRVSPVGTITIPSDFQYAGMYEHPSSLLNLTKYRAYDPNAGRWLSRDPLDEKTGPNLYDYVANAPTNLIDPLGLTSASRTYQDPLGNVVPYILGAIIAAPVVVELGGSALTASLASRFPWLVPAAGAAKGLANGINGQPGECPLQAWENEGGALADRNPKLLPPGPIHPDTLIPISDEPGKFIRWGDIPMGGMIGPFGYVTDKGPMITSLADSINLDYGK